MKERIASLVLLAFGICLPASAAELKSNVVFILADDLDEKNDIAAKNPERVKAMDALIEKFPAETKSVLPAPNPALDPAKYHPEDESKDPSSLSRI